MELSQGDFLSGVPFSDIAPVVRLVHKLPSREQLFCFEYAVDKNGTKAAIRAGYAVKAAAQQASRMLRNVKVKAAINEIVGSIHEKLEISAERIRYELSCSAFFDPQSITNTDGSIKPMSEWPEHARRALPVIEANHRLIVRKGEVVETVGNEIRVPGKIESLKLLGQEKRMFIERREHDIGEKTLEDIVALQGSKEAAA